MEEDPLSSDWEPLKKDFRAGNIGMYLGDSTVVPQFTSDILKESDIGIFPFPFDNDENGKRYVTRLIDAGIGISKNSKNLESAKLFFEFMMNEKYSDFSQKCGLIPAKDGIEVNYDYYNEFKKFPVTFLDGRPRTQKTMEMINKSQIQFTARAQEVLSGISIETVLQSMNKSWKKAHEN
ncbi:MAG: hypothetical protein BGN88_03790 [Clostridiales bacterium 43-6]|nr:MAG: hypothetical protein BGN88_03790 [Clostridiales bacterium 43-6]